MSRFQKLSHVLWHCQYHIVWTPKYRFRVLKDQVSREVNNCIKGLSISLALCCVPFMSEQKSHPISGIDYPRTLQEFDEWFWSEEACFLHFPAALARRV